MPSDILAVESLDRGLSTYIKLQMCANISLP